MKKLLASSMTLAVIASLAFAGDARAYYPTGENPDGGGAGCSKGPLLCSSVVTQKCTEWYSTGGGINIGPGSGGISITLSCKTWQTTTIYYYMS
jgi:hypothetical protein